jgi:thiol:disulfide interchange protein DsbC
MSRLILASILCAIVTLGQAAESREAAIKRILESRAPGTKVLNVGKSPMPGLYEAYVEGQLVYTDAKADFVLQGNLLDSKTGKNLSEARLEQLSMVKFESLPFDLAIRQVRGSGARSVAVFSDPNCPYCKRFEKDLARLEDVTVYLFLYPVLSKDSIEKSRAIWCSPDRAKAWNEYMSQGKAPSAAGSCDNPVDRIVEYGGSHHFVGTPTLLFQNGKRVTGAIQFAELSRHLADAAKR